MVAKGKPMEMDRLRPGTPLPDSEIIVIGSGTTPGSFVLRPGIDTRSIGSVTIPGKSASIATDLTLQHEILRMFGRLLKALDRISGAFVEDVRAAGFDVVYAPTPNNPRHVRIISAYRTFDAVGRQWLSIAFDLLARIGRRVPE
jgi:hypothetical protein